MTQALAMACSWALAGILLLAAAHKARNYLEFRGVLLQYRLLPESLVPAVAPLIIAAEAAAGLALLVPAATLTPSTAVLTPATGSLMAALLLCLYTGAIAVNLGRGRSAIDCGCGGQATPLSGWLLTRNGLLLCLAWAAAALPSGTATPGAYALAAASAVFLWCAYASGNQLLANRGRAQLAWGADG